MAIPEMTHTVSSGTLNSTHSLSVFCFTDQLRQHCC